MSLELLRAELRDDPAGIGYAGKTDAECLALLTAKTRSRLKSLASTELLAWAAGGGRLANLWDAASNAQMPAAVRSIARAAALMLERDGTSLDLNLPDRAALVDGLVASGVLNQADKDALITLATEQVSRLQELGIGEMHEGDVHYVRFGHPA